MKTLRFIVIGLLFVAAACQPATEEAPLPTLAQLPSATPTEGASPTPEPTDTPPPTATNTAEPSSTPEPTDTPPPPTATNSPTSEPSPTVDLTRVFIGTATAAVQEAPKIATFTPLPPGQPTPTGTPQAIADVIITERQFSEEINLIVSSMPQIERAIVDFTIEGVLINVTAQDEGGALTSGDLLVTMETQGGVARIQGVLLWPDDAPEPSETFLQLVTGEFFLKVVEAFDNILTQRLGETHNLETITITNSAIEIMLLVPQER